MEIKTGKNKSGADSPAVPVPPDRSTAHKKTVQKFQRSRRMAIRLLAALKGLAMLGIVALVIVGGISVYRYAFLSDLFSLRNIVFQGCRHLNPQDLEAIVRQAQPSNLLEIDLEQLRVRLEQEPWVRRAELRRILPGSLRVYIEERVPSVIAEVGGELELLDRDGVLLDQYQSSYGKFDVPVFRGLCGNDVAGYVEMQKENTARVRLGVAILTELESGSPELARAISEIDLTDPENVRTLLIDDTAEIFLGNRDFLKRFQAFMAEYDGMKAQFGEIISVDLRFYPQIVYRPRQLADQPGEKGPGFGHRPE